MWTYVDESGNTGNQLFDESQPVFITAAMMTKTNFDLVYKAELQALSRKVGLVALHANELGVGRIEDVAGELLRIMKDADARFFASRVEKRYLAAAKVCDTYFDAGENLAVPWHVYWLRPLRLILMFKLAYFILTDDSVQLVWQCLTAPNERTSKKLFGQAAVAMLANVPNLPDARSREIVSRALEWAVENPENFTTHVRGRLQTYTHAPNFVAFTNLLDGIDQASRRWARPVREIVHDQQPQFERTLKEWHEVISNPAREGEEPVHWPGEDAPFRLSKVIGSKFRMTTEQESAGLQVIDVLLWLFKRVLDGKEIGPNGSKLLGRFFKRGYQNDLSFTGVGESLEEAFQRIMSADIPDDQMAAGAELMERERASRGSALAAYAESKKAIAR
jgi:hypothetical protein